jgi:hypothetical protein
MRESEQQVAAKQLHQFQRYNAHAAVQVVFQVAPARLCSDDQAGPLIVIVDAVGLHHMWVWNLQRLQRQHLPGGVHWISVRVVISPPLGRWFLEKHLL